MLEPLEGTNSNTSAPELYISTSISKQIKKQFNTDITLLDLCADPATHSRKRRKTLKGTNLASRMGTIHYISLFYSKTPNPEELLSILPKIATSTVQLLSKLRKIDDIK
jgi:hypothetical protein